MTDLIDFIREHWNKQVQRLVTAVVCAGLAGMCGGAADYLGKINERVTAGTLLGVTIVLAVIAIGHLLAAAAAAMDEIL